MRIYAEDQNSMPVQVLCNGCGRELLVEHGILKEECIHVEHECGFFGKRDGEGQSFDLCEQCYEKLLEDLTIPAQTWNRTELL